MTAERLNKTLPSAAARDAWTFFEHWKPWLGRYLTIGFCISLFVHVIGLGSLSIMLFDRIQQESIGTMLGLGGGEGGGGSGGEIEQLLDTRVELAPSDELVTDIPRFESTALVRPNISIGSISTGANTGGSGAGKGTGTGDGKDGFRFSMPGNGRAVVKGNFAAWTEPADPKPSEPYKIVIQIKLPKNIRSYPLTDLSGLVEGTDQYVQTIPSSVRETLPVIDNQTQFIVDVPGAAELVKDTITVRSRMLREKQQLEIVF